MRSHIRPGKAIYKDSPVANCTGRNYAAVREVHWRFHIIDVQQVILLKVNTISEKLFKICENSLNSLKFINSMLNFPVHFSHKMLRS